MTTQISTHSQKKKSWSDPQLFIIDRNEISVIKSNAFVREGTGHTLVTNGYKYLVNSAGTKKATLSKHSNPLQNLSSFAS